MTAEWMARAACARLDLPDTVIDEMFFGSQSGKRICMDCPVAADCLRHALASEPTLDGIWGGTDRAERTRLRRGTSKLQPSPATKQAALDLWQQVRDHYSSDHAVSRAIARQLDVDDCTVLRWARAANIAAQPQVNIRTPEERAAAVDHYRRERPAHRTNTAAMDVVAEARGVSRAALRDWLRAEGVIAAEPRAPRNRREPKAEKAAQPI